MEVSRRFLFGAIVSGITMAQAGISFADVPDRYRRLMTARDRALVISDELKKAGIQSWTPGRSYQKQFPEIYSRLKDANNDFFGIMADEFDLNATPQDVEVMRDFWSNPRSFTEEELEKLPDASYCLILTKYSISGDSMMMVNEPGMRFSEISPYLKELVFV